MLGIIIDTSSQQGILGLARDKSLISQRKLEGGTQLSRSFLPALAAMMQEEGFVFHDLTYIAVGRGPGSYTGTRVGVAIARSLAFALDISLISFCSLKAFIALASGTFVCWMESKGESFYAIKGRVLKGELSIEKQGSFTYADWPSLIESVDILLSKENAAPCPAHLLPLLIQKFQNNITDCDILYFHNLIAH